MPEVTQHWRRDTETWPWAPDKIWVTTPTPYQLGSLVATSSMTRGPVASSNIKGAGNPNKSYFCSSRPARYIRHTRGWAAPARPEELRTRLFLEAKVRSRVGGGAAAWDWPGPERKSVRPCGEGPYCVQAGAKKGHSYHHAQAPSRWSCLEAKA